MTTFFVRFSNDHASASAELDANSIEEASILAYELAAHQTGLTFETHWRLHPVDEIAILPPDADERIWESRNSRIRRLAPEVITAAADVIEALEHEGIATRMFNQRTHAMILRLAHLVELADGRDA